MSVLAQLAEYVVTADAGALPPAERDMLRRHLTDTVLARLVGARAVDGKALAALIQGKSPEGKFPEGKFPEGKFPEGKSPGGECREGECPNADGIALLAATVRLTEIDDIHLASCTTPSSVAVPVALALASTGRAARGGLDPGRILGAIWVGTELVVRLGQTIDGARVLYQGIWPTRVGAPLGAAAVACRMWGLDVQQTAHALSLALMMTPPRMGRIGGQPSGRWILFMAAIGDGVRAAEAARAGFTGDAALLDGDWLQRMLGVPVVSDRLTEDLGLGSIYPELSLKPYGTSRQALSAAEAMRQLVADGLAPSDIRSVRICVPTAYAGMISTRLDPAVRASSFISAGAMIAIAALAPTSLFDVDRDDIAADPGVRALADKVSVEPDPALDTLYPRQWPARLEVETAAGIRHVLIEHASGDPTRRLDDDGVLAKAVAVLARHGAASRADDLVALCRQATADHDALSRLARLFADADLSV